VAALDSVMLAGREQTECAVSTEGIARLIPSATDPAAHSVIEVRPSIADEIEGALTRLKRHVDSGEPLDFGGAVVVPPGLAQEAAQFWSDGLRNFGELAVLAHWAGRSFDTDPGDLLDGLDATIASAPHQDLGLASEQPAERALIEERIGRLGRDAKLRAAYTNLIATLWAALRSEWNERGLEAVLRSCLEWRTRIAEGTPLIELLPPDHTVFVHDLVPLVKAALSRGEVVISPAYFITRGHVLDLAGLLSIGVMARAQSLRNVYADRGRTITSLTKALASPLRAAVLSRLLESSASADEIAADLDITSPVARAQIRHLRPYGLVQRVPNQHPARYVALEATVNRVLDDVSAQLQGGHGRAAARHAADIAADASFRAIFDDAPIAMIQLDLQGRCLSCNRAAQQMFGYEEAEMSQLRGTHLLAEDTDHGAFEIAGELEPGQKRRDVRLRGKDGAVFWGSVTVSKVEDSSGQLAFGYAMIEAVSERAGGEDLVTGLPNRALFVTRLERLLALSRRRGEAVAVLMLDLDRFKYVNDTFGHDAGDELLKQVSARLVSVLRAADVVGRLGGDEFGVFPMGVTSAVALEQVADKVRTAIAAPFTLAGGQVVSIGTSVGGAISLHDGSTAAELMKRADQAMYVAKKASRGAGSHQT
jgi:diguanylate cyclase (GGDEF)-like protein/PAS domain S-box-containing protein